MHYNSHHISRSNYSPSNFEGNARLHDASFIYRYYENSENKVYITAKRTRKIMPIITTATATNNTDFIVINMEK